MYPGTPRTSPAAALRSSPSLTSYPRRTSMPGAAVKRVTGTPLRLGSYGRYCFIRRGEEGRVAETVKILCQRHTTCGLACTVPGVAKRVVIPQGALSSQQQGRQGDGFTVRARQPVWPYSYGHGQLSICCTPSAGPHGFHFLHLPLCLDHTYPCAVRTVVSRSLHTCIRLPATVRDSSPGIVSSWACLYQKHRDGSSKDHTWEHVGGKATVQSQAGMRPACESPCTEEGPKQSP